MRDKMGRSEEAQRMRDKLRSAGLYEMSVKKYRSSQMRSLFVHGGLLFVALAAVLLFALVYRSGAPSGEDHVEPGGTSIAEDLFSTALDKDAPAYQLNIVANRALNELSPLSENGDMVALSLRVIGRSRIRGPAVRDFCLDALRSSDSRAQMAAKVWVPVIFPDWKTDRELFEGVSQLEEK